MNIYKVWQNKCSGYDTYSDFVIVCENETIAKNTHPRGYSLDSHRSRDWTTEVSDINCQFLGKSAKGVEEGIVCSSFHAG